MNFHTQKNLICIINRSKVIERKQNKLKCTVKLAMTKAQGTGKKFYFSQISALGGVKIQVFL